MLTLLYRVWRSMLNPEPVDVLEPVRPMVTPDPAATVELERRRAALSYRPRTNFHCDTLVRKAQ